jgi:hypothetical protein
MEAGMDEKIMQEIFHEFISSLEALDTQNSAISQFLKDKGIVPPKELAPYLEQAGNASSVRWLGTRVRIDYLFSSAAKEEDDDANSPAKSAGKADDSESASGSKPEAEQSTASKGEREVKASKDAGQDVDQGERKVNRQDNRSSESTVHPDADAD